MQSHTNPSLTLMQGLFYKCNKYNLIHIYTFYFTTGTIKFCIEQLRMHGLEKKIGTGFSFDISGVKSHHKMQRVFFKLL